jgi:protein-S-isoprenylcysteine O-methyltransferase Ste14
VSAIGLFARNLLWTALLPGVIAAYLPWTFFGLSEVRVAFTANQLVGAVCIIVGAALLGACIREFARRGRGTLAPVDPPRVLVVQGLYRYVRNPMYLSVTLIILGEAIVAWSGSLVIYGLVWFAWVNIFVLAYEEPALRRQFGASYDEYTRRVGRWIPTRAH